MDNRLILNSNNESVLQEINNSLNGCLKFYFNVAFATYSGVQLLLEQLKNAEDKGAKGKVITSTYLNFTDPKAIRKINSFDNIETKVFVAKNTQGFHPKAYIFEYDNFYKVIVGSANLTQSALKSNIEWNISFITKNDDGILNKILDEFNKIWREAISVSEEFLKKYEDFLFSIKTIQKNNKEFVHELAGDVKPNIMQEQALQSLIRLRNHGESKALVIAATGSGKTYMSAFDVAKFNPGRLLFIVHREDILNSALKSFRKILHNNTNKTFGKLSQSHKDYDADYLFSTNISLNNNIDKFKPNSFDYVIIDEAHHIGGETYKRILNYFTPKFLLGMTATPERGDAHDIYKAFDNNVATEIRLRDALEEDLVVPFHYFGITDAQGVDYSDTNMKDVAELAKKLQTNARVNHIIDKMNFYGFEGTKRRAIGFCVSINHARYMSSEFSKRGIPSIYLIGGDKQEQRKNTIDRLESETDELEVIFTVDIFNEGVDIPSINTILMLRPTASPIVFIQQLGRGLRKHHSKTFVTILDFIGNYSKSFLLAIALNGRKFFDKDSLKVAVVNDFSSLPGCTNIQFDKIAKEQILQQIENERFNTLAYCKEEYLTFKLLIGNKIPSLFDFFSVDGAPDPLSFRVGTIKTFFDFQRKVEKDAIKYSDFYSNHIAVKFLRFIEDLLPVKRLVDILALKLIIKQGNFTIDSLKNESLKHLNNIDNSTLLHCLNFLSGIYFDILDKNKYPEIGVVKENKFEVNENVLETLKNNKISSILLDTINYGIFRYEDEFTDREIKTPDLVLYSQYNMRQVAIACNLNKKISSFRGQGLLRFNKDYFLFIDLHKEEEATNYRDEFISQTVFQWDSPNGTSQKTETGQNLIQHKDKGYNLHLFVRKFSKIDGDTQGFVYIGKGDVINYKENKPILFNIKLEKEVPSNIYVEFESVV